MEAAGLYAFAAASDRTVVCFARLTNVMAAHGDDDFDKDVDEGVHVTLALARAVTLALNT